MKSYKIFPVAVLAAMILSGCASTLRDAIFPPSNMPTRYFVLSSAIQETPDDASLPNVIFSRINVPAYLDVPQVVTRSGNEISKNEKIRWGEPLPRGVARELALRCEASLAARKISGKQPVVSVTLDRLDGALDGNVCIAATYTLYRSTKTGVPANTVSAPSTIFKTEIPVAEPNDYDAYILTLNSALDALAKDIADAIIEFSAANAQ